MARGRKGKAKWRGALLARKKNKTGRRNFLSGVRRKRANAATRHARTKAEIGNKGKGTERVSRRDLGMVEQQKPRGGVRAKGPKVAKRNAKRKKKKKSKRASQTTRELKGAGGEVIDGESVKEAANRYLPKSKKPVWKMTDKEYLAHLKHIYAAGAYEPDIGQCSNCGSLRVGECIVCPLTAAEEKEFALEGASELAHKVLEQKIPGLGEKAWHLNRFVSLGCSSSRGMRKAVRRARGPTLPAGRRQQGHVVLRVKHGNDTKGINVTKVVLGESTDVLDAEAREDFGVAAKDVRIARQEIKKRNELLRFALPKEAEEFVIYSKHGKIGAGVPRAARARGAETATLSGFAKRQKQIEAKYGGPHAAHFVCRTGPVWESKGDKAAAKKRSKGKANSKLKVLKPSDKKGQRVTSGVMVSALSPAWDALLFGLLYCGGWNRY